MTHTAQARFIDAITPTITSCSICVEHYKGRFCTQNKKHGLCIQTKSGKVYGYIGSMEQIAAIDLERWCEEEITVSGAPD